MSEESAGMSHTDARLASFNQMRTMPIAELTHRIDMIGESHGNQWHLNELRDELARRESQEQNRRLEDLTEQLRRLTVWLVRLTVAIAVMTGVILVLTALLFMRGG